MARPRPRTGARSASSGDEGTAQQTYEGTTSGYGPTRGESVGYTPRSPKAYSKARIAYGKNQEERTGNS